MKRETRHIVALIVLMMSSRVRADCRFSDIKSIMGGDYIVDDMRGSYVTYSDRNALLVYGKYTNTDAVSKGYAFIYDYSYCAASNFFEFAEVNQGIKEAFNPTKEADYVYLLGYNLPDPDVPETLEEVIFRLAFATLDTKTKLLTFMKDYDTMTYEIPSVE